MIENREFWCQCCGGDGVLLGWLEEAQQGEGSGIGIFCAGWCRIIGVAFPVILLSLGWWRGVGGA